MRKTLVFKGISEDGKETWDDTREILAETISQNIKRFSYDDAYDLFDRVHRSSPTTNARKHNKRDIFAALHTWDDCEFIINMFTKLNRKNPNLKIYVDYKYGPLTTRRRNEALKMRRELLNDGTIARGYISYPAKLCVKYNTNDKDWVVHENFSKRSIPGRSLFTVAPPPPSND